MQKSTPTVAIKSEKPQAIEEDKKSIITKHISLGQHSISDNLSHLGVAGAGSDFADTIKRW